MKICFAGTPDFAVPSLEALLHSRHQVALVVTQPDRPVGRRRRVSPPPIKRKALDHDVPVIQPEGLNRPEALEALRATAPHALVVVAYGNILSRHVLDIPSRGCFNVHASLLPRYRGAAPIQHAILNGDRVTGVTVQRLVRKVDAGPILDQRSIDIGPDETAGELSDRLAALGGEMIVPVLDAVEKGTAQEEPQSEHGVTYAPKLSKRDGLIPWHLEANAVRDFIRAMTPWPGAFATLHGAKGEPKGRLTLLAARPLQSSDPRPEPGVVVRAHGELIVATGRGFLSLTRLKPEGGRPMDAPAYLRGHDVAPGDRLHGA